MSPLIHLSTYSGAGACAEAQAFPGSSLDVNPTIGIKDGEVHPFARRRSRAQAIDYLCSFAAGFGNLEALAVEHVTDVDEPDRLVRSLKANHPQVPVYLSRASPVIGTHTGPGLIGVSVFGDRLSAAQQRLQLVQNAVGSHHKRM